MSFDISLSRRIGVFDLQLEIHTNATVIGVVGRSGAGKTSLLNMVAGLMKPDRGAIAVAGRTLFDSDVGIDVAPEQRHCGYVFQDARLFPHLRVGDNLAYGLQRTAERRPLFDFDHVVTFLDIFPLLRRWPGSLSGGEARRVAIGRALLSGPDFLLLDEPLTGLDAARREEILTVLENLCDEFNLPTLYVSHDRSEVDRLASNIISLN